MPYQQLSRHLAGASVLLLVLIIAGCSKKDSDSGVIHAVVSKCFSGYVDGYPDLSAGYAARPNGQSKAPWGLQHYAVEGYLEGRDLPYGCADQIKATEANWIAYIDKYPDLKAAYEAWAASTGSGKTTAIKADWGQNHYQKHADTERDRRLPESASNVGLGVYLLPVTSTASASGASGSSAGSDESDPSALYTDAQILAYMNSYPDLLTVAGTDAERIAYGRAHYRNFGKAEGRTLGLVVAAAEAEAEPAAESSGAVAETLPTVSLACATASISEDGGTSNCTLTLSKTYSQAVTVTVAYSGSATAGTDYSGNTTSHTISAGSTTTSWTITGLNDGFIESDETIVIDIASVTNGTEQNTQTASISLSNLCIAPGTAITDANFSAAITDWERNGNGSVYGNIALWCTGNVTDMRAAFRTSSFNTDISGWDTSSVTDMSRMFLLATNFNQDIGNWDTSNVTSMDLMFYRASAFNQDISGWDTSNVTNMSYMFQDATAFNQNLSSWNAASLTNGSCTAFATGATAWLAAYGGAIANKTPPLSASLIAAGCGN